MVSFLAYSIFSVLLKEASGHLIWLFLTKMFYDKLKFEQMLLQHNKLPKNENYKVQYAVPSHWQKRALTKRLLRSLFWFLWWSNVAPYIHVFLCCLHWDWVRIFLQESCLNHHQQGKKETVNKFSIPLLEGAIAESHRVLCTSLFLLVWSTWYVQKSVWYVCVWSLNLMADFWWANMRHFVFLSEIALLFFFSILVYFKKSCFSMCPLLS